MNAHFRRCFLFFLLLFSQVVSEAQKDRSVALLKGRLQQFGATAIVEDFSELQFILPVSANPVISPNSDSSFEISIALKQPGYYRIGRNKLYLSPGDNLKVILNQANASHSEFSGKGSVANNYLRKVPFPKSGSYLAAGGEIKETPAEMWQFLLSEYRGRQQELLSLKGVTPVFKTLEQARNRADLIKSIQSVSAYARVKFRDKPQEFEKEYVKEFEQITSKTLDSLLRRFINPLFLQIEVYRDILPYLKEEGISAKEIEQIADWRKARTLAVSRIKPESDKSRLPLLKSGIDSIQNSRYRKALTWLYAEKMKFGNGDPAIDFSVRTEGGDSVLLSSLRGKVIYIDLWATWCGPCMAEMPHLEKLKEKYSGQEDVAIVSLSVDDTDAVWLKNLRTRNPGGIQWRISRPKLAEYDVVSIPRYILIGRDFRIVEMDAPHASKQEEVSRLIDALLAKK